MMDVKVAVEARASTGGYESAVVYLTSNRPFSGVKVRLALRKGVAVTGCWPRWPDYMSENIAEWTAEPYPRRFSCLTLYSFGVRLELKGGVRLTAKVETWRVKDGYVELKAARTKGLTAVIGPFSRETSVHAFSGELLATPGGGFPYLVAEGRFVHVLAEFKAGMVSGYMEYEPEEDELPFEIEIKGVESVVKRCTLIARLDDLSVHSRL